MSTTRTVIRHAEQRRRSGAALTALAALRTEIDAVRETLPQHGKSLDGHEQWLSDHSKILADYGQALDRMDKWVARLERAQAAYHDDHEHGEHRERRRQLDELELAQSVRVFMDWIEHARLRTAPRVSVIMPTHNRVGYLPRAIASVQAQTYPGWELVVVDDASADTTSEFLATVDDPRVAPIRVRLTSFSQRPLHLGCICEAVLRQVANESWSIVSAGAHRSWNGVRRHIQFCPRVRHGRSRCRTAMQETEASSDVHTSVDRSLMRRQLRAVAWRRRPRGLG